MLQMFEKQLQKNVARLSIDISILRNQSKANTVHKCQAFCTAINLKDFFIALQGNYKEYLDSQTILLQADCKIEELKFGSARKVLNIFFKSICYNGIFQEIHGLAGQDLISHESIISKLELPIDSKVAKRLNPSMKWHSIKGLSVEDHEEYQRKAIAISKKERIARVHLDVFYWSD